jgi:hypothetical protein
MTQLSTCLCNVLPNVSRSSNDQNTALPHFGDYSVIIDPRISFQWEGSENNYIIPTRSSCILIPQIVARSMNKYPPSQAHTSYNMRCICKNSWVYPRPMCLTIVICQNANNKLSVFFSFLGAVMNCLPIHHLEWSIYLRSWSKRREIHLSFTHFNVLNF